MLNQLTQLIAAATKTQAGVPTEAAGICPTVYTLLTDSDVNLS